MEVDALLVRAGALRSLAQGPGIEAALQGVPTLEAEEWARVVFDGVLPEYAVPVLAGALGMMPASDTWTAITTLLALNDIDSNSHEDRRRQLAVRRGVSEGTVLKWEQEGALQLVVALDEWIQLHGPIPERNLTYEDRSERLDDELAVYDQMRWVDVHQDVHTKRRQLMRMQVESEALQELNQRWYT